MDSVAVLNWGRIPPPLGGVTRTVQTLDDGLKRLEVPTRIVSPRSLRSVLRATPLLLFGRTVSVFHVSSAKRAILLLPFALLARRRAIIFIHGTSSVAWVRERGLAARRIIRACLISFGCGVWVNNGLIADEFHKLLGIRALIVSPFDSSQVSLNSSAPGSCAVAKAEDVLVTSALQALPYYGLGLAVDAVDFLRERTNRDWKLHILLYGEGAFSVPEWLAQKMQTDHWIRVHRNLDRCSSLQLVKSANALLRLTDRDGDSLIVREALEMGTRVIATQVVPRPAGTELTLPTVEGVADTIITGGTQSSGDGMGRSMLEATIDVVAQIQDISSRRRS